MNGCRDTSKSKISSRMEETRWSKSKESLTTTVLASGNMKVFIGNTSMGFLNILKGVHVLYELSEWHATTDEQRRVKRTLRKTKNRNRNTSCNLTFIKQFNKSKDLVLPIISIPGHKGTMAWLGCCISLEILC